MCEGHRRVNTIERSRSTVATVSKPSPRALAVAQQQGGAAMRTIDAPAAPVRELTPPAGARPAPTKPTTATKNGAPAQPQKPAAPKPAPAPAPQQHPAIARLAELAALEDQLRDKGELKENLFNTEALRDLAHMLGIRGVDLKLSGSPNKNLIADAAQQVRRALVQRVFGSEAQALGKPMPEILKK